MRLPFFFIPIVTMLLCITGCSASVQREKENEMIDGQVVFIELEGGFYGIETRDSEKLFPLNLEESCRKHGLKIKFSYRVAKNVKTAVMWGTPVEILSIKKK